MSDVPVSLGIDRPQLGLVGRLATLTSWALAAALFLTVGWMALAPDDPLGSVSVLTRRGGLTMLVEAAVMAAVMAALATVIVGRQLPDVGTFAAALGLAVVSLRGATAEYLLVHNSSAVEWTERALAWRFALEAGAWFIVLIIAAGIVAPVTHWCFGRSKQRPAGVKDGFSTPIAASSDFPGVSARWPDVRGGAQTPAGDGVRHMLTAGGVGIAAMALLSTGLSSRVIQHGQVCFVVAASVCIATYVAYRVIPVQSALWSILAVGLLSLAGYIWALARPPVMGLPPNIPSSHFMRVLPIQFISIGVATAVATFWYVYVPVANPPRAGRTVKRSPKQAGTR